MLYLRVSLSLVASADLTAFPLYIVNGFFSRMKLTKYAIIFYFEIVL